MIRVSFDTTKRQTMIMNSLFLSCVIFFIVEHSFCVIFVEKKTGKQIH